MRIEVLAIGDELLDGRVADTNTLRLAEALGEIGLGLSQRTTLPDDIDRIVSEAKAIAARKTALCVVSGGLGPTSDDVTAAAFATLMGEDLVRDSAQVARIEKMLAFRKRSLTPNQAKQADRPASAQLIENPAGTAPGFSVTYAGCRFVALPGVPREYDIMVAAAIISELSEGRAPLPKRTLRCFGIPEAEADARLDELRVQWPDIRLGFRAHFPEIHVTLRGASASLEAAFAHAQERLAKETYSTRDEELAAVVLAELRERKMTLVLAESCTGGLLGDMVTNVPGASDVFWGAMVTYSNDAKTRLLGVDESLLEDHGAVSEPVVVAMARGALERSGADIAVAVSGIAGPGGGTAEKPVGTVCLAVASATGEPKARTLYFPFDRRRNKTISAFAALDAVRRYIAREQP